MNYEKTFGYYRAKVFEFKLFKRNALSMFLSLNCFQEIV